MPQPDQMFAQPPFSHGAEAAGALPPASELGMPVVAGCLDAVVGSAPTCRVVALMTTGRHAQAYKSHGG